MNFEEEYIYHIYNQGNNRRKIFHSRENYLFFLKKVKTHFTPYADILAWCLMPNHFHFMVYIRPSANPETTTQTRHVKSNNTLNNSIAVVLRSYTRAINNQENQSGSLFKAHTKSECVNCPKGLTPSFIIKDSITSIKSQNHEEQYPNICFNYIHQNPVKANLVPKNTDWEFSSAKDYAGLRDGVLVNKNLANEYGLKLI